MNKKYPLIFLLLLSVLFMPCYSEALAWVNRNEDLMRSHNQENSILICSPGRSGSSMLTGVLCLCAPGRKILKSHMLPPSKEFKGKVIFIFSNPDLAAESALHRTINEVGFGHSHFFHVETSDMNWYRKIGKTTAQNQKHNLLNYDALGCTKQLQSWLYEDTKKSSSRSAQVLSIRFEDIWDPKTIAAIESFLQIKKLELPPKRERGYSGDELNPQEKMIRKKFNKGTEEDPRYDAYKKARILWKKAKSFEYFRLKK